MVTRRISRIVFLLLFLLLLLPLGVVLSGRTSVYKSIDSVEATPVALVFGAGLTVNNTPSDALMDRLTVAAELYHRGLVDRLLLSGDNHVQEYNEPDVMKRTLLSEFNIPEENLFADYAGRRTYDTCRRARELWGIEHAILVTQGYHLPRAIWTCEALGIQSDGISSTLQPYLKELAFKMREVGAIYKSFIDLYLIEPPYIAGEFIQDLDP
jgi:SanA protein